MYSPDHCTRRPLPPARRSATLYRDSDNVLTPHTLARHRGVVMPPLSAPGEPNYLIALLVAAPLLVVGGTCAFVIARVTAWYARRWRGPHDR